jgi:tetratricopeptide (TPR) repeat protein/predicted Ser/Thr protein kinase
MEDSPDVSCLRTRAEREGDPHIAPPPTAPQAPLIGRYTLLRELGRGGMGTVYSAYDEELDRKVAIKLLHQTSGASLGAPRLLGEAQALARLSHPNVVQVYDVGVLGEQVFLAMEYVNGETLRAWQRGAPRGWRETLSLYRQVGEGLTAAHAAGLVHGDVKPDNLMIGDDGRVRVMDFGLARRKPAPLREDGSLGGVRSAPLDERESPGGVAGTPAYMPFEQMCGESIGVEADTFAFCVSLWEGMHGVRPFASETLAGLRKSVALGRVVEPPADRPTPRWLRDILVHGLAPDPACRPSITAILAAIDDGLARTTRRRAAAWIAASLAVTVALVSAGLAWQSADHRAHVAACERLGAEVDGAWNDEARARLRDAMLGRGLPFAADSVDRVLPRLDAWAAAWTRVRVETCFKDQVDHVWSADLSVRAADCLDERLLDFDARVAELSTGVAGSVISAVDAAMSLADPGACGDPQQLARRPTLPEAGHERLREIRATLARTRALEYTGRYAEGEVLARQTLAAAEALAWPPAVAEARVRLGALETLQSRFEAAATNLDAAYFTAARAGAQEIAAEAAIRLSLAVGWGLRRRDEGLRWSRHAELGLLALETGGRTLLDIDWLDHRGLTHQIAAEHREGADDFRAALALTEAVLGPEHPRLASLLNNLAIAQGQLGELDAALDSAARALAHAERTLGPEHPDVATCARTLAIRAISVARGLDPAAAEREYAKADALFERTISIDRRVFGPDSREVANHLHPLAHLRTLRGQTEGVEALYRESLALIEKHDPDDPVIPHILTRLALTQDAFGDPAAALQTLAGALAHARRVLPKDHPDMAYSLHALGLVHLHLGDLEAARPSVEEAHAIRQRAKFAHPIYLNEGLRTLALLEILAGDLARGREYLERASADSTAGDLAEARFALAKATWERAPGERPAALALALLARDGYASTGKRTDRQRAAVDAWLSAHR